jgi:hypothetical protein
LKEENSEDPDDAWDPTGYYRRKAARQDEELKGCLWVVLLAVLMGLAIGAYELITGEEVFTRDPDDIDRLLITTPSGD